MTSINFFGGFTKNKIENAMKHADKFRSGARKRKSINLTPKEKFNVVMNEYANGTLYSGSGEKVTSKEQALAIAYSEARKTKGSKLQLKEFKKITGKVK